MTESTGNHAQASSDDNVKKFRKCWIASTADSNLTLHGFRRFKTTHLLNLRLLEHEIAELDHAIYQAGFSLGLSPTSTDRLGLKHGKRDAQAPNVRDTMNEEFVLKLRDLIRQYDEALAAFNNVMKMETFSLLDDGQQSSLRDDLNLYEAYNTRLLRADLGTRSRTDPFQRWLHRYLRAFRYRRLSRKFQYNDGLRSLSGRDWTSQNTILIAEVVGRITTAAFTAIFLIAPLAILSHQSSKNTQLVVISVCIIILSLLVSLLLKVSSFEMMAISAAYAAILSVFVSNGPVKN